MRNRRSMAGDVRKLSRPGCWTVDLKRAGRDTGSSCSKQQLERGKGIVLTFSNHPKIITVLAIPCAHCHASDTLLLSDSTRQNYRHIRFRHMQRLQWFPRRSDVPKRHSGRLCRGGQRRPDVTRLGGGERRLGHHFQGLFLSQIGSSSLAYGSAQHGFGGGLLQSEPSQRVPG